MQIDEKTEITIPIKLLVSVVSCIVVAAWYVFTTQSRIKDLEHSVVLANHRFETYIQQPGREQLQVELLKKDVEFLRNEIEQLKRGTK